MNMKKTTIMKKAVELPLKDRVELAKRLLVNISNEYECGAKSIPLSYNPRMKYRDGIEDLAETAANLDCYAKLIYR